jgi:hypothetical protein
MVRGSSDLRPIVVSNAAGNRSSFAPNLPLVRRHTQMCAREMLEQQSDQSRVADALGHAA